MKKITANILKTELPKKSAFVIETEAPFPKLHTLTIMVGKRGGGKSVALANYLRVLKDKQYIQKVFLITPTYNSNKTIWDIADIDENDVVEPTKNSIKEILIKGQEEVDEYNDFLEKNKDRYEYIVFVHDDVYVDDLAVCRYKTPSSTVL